VYDTEVKNFKDFGDLGEVWFGEQSVDKMIQWVQDYEIPFEAKIVDVGCGNGHLLLELADLGYKNLIGLDYSESAIELAQSIVESKKMDSIKYQVMNILRPDLGPIFKASSDLILDKGTFDAISLATPFDLGMTSQNDIQIAYVNAIASLLAENGVLLITSCNWTHEELLDCFKGKFKLHSTVKYPTFRFGGQTGQTIVTLAFQKLPL
jgi:SAM-dependent methyltransferase